MLSRPGLVFAGLGVLGLVLPFVQFKPNRIAAGQGVALPWGLDTGWAIAMGLGAVLTLACLRRVPDGLRLAGAGIGLVVSIVMLGLVAQALSQTGGRLARVSPASGFWLLLLAFALMATDALARLRPGLAMRAALILALVLGVVAILSSGVLDQVSVLREYATRREGFVAQARAHLVLAFGSTGLALLVGLPLGIALHQAPRWRLPVLAGLNVLQTIPSLALFGVMIPLLAWLAATLPMLRAMGLSGIGMVPALTALFLYALLPIVSNTVSGLSAVPARVRDAAAGLGMTPVQMLGQVMLPLALPALLAGVRIVLVQNIGLAVIAGLIGGGGFGTFVFQGLNQNAMDLVLLGTLPTIAMALLAGAVMDLLVDLGRHGKGMA